MTESVDLGIRVKAARIAANLSQEELAEIVGISIQALSRIETGKTQPKLTTLRKIADKTGQPLAWLFQSGQVETRQRVRRTASAPHQVDVSSAPSPRRGRVLPGTERLGTADVKQLLVEIKDAANATKQAIDDQKDAFVSTVDTALMRIASVLERMDQRLDAQERILHDIRAGPEEQARGA